MYVRHTAQHQGTVQQRTGCRQRGRKAGKGTIVRIDQSNALVVVSTTCEQGQGRARQVDLVVYHVVGDKLGLEEARGRMTPRPTVPHVQRPGDRHHVGDLDDERSCGAHYLMLAERL